MLCPVSATQSAAALLHHLGRSIDRASRSRHSKFKPAVLGEIQAAGDNMRLVPDMTAADTLAKLKAHLAAWVCRP